MTNIGKINIGNPRHPNQRDLDSFEAAAAGAVQLTIVRPETAVALLQQSRTEPTLAPVAQAVVSVLGRDHPHCLLCETIVHGRIPAIGVASPYRTPGEEPEDGLPILGFALCQTHASLPDEALRDAIMSDLCPGSEIIDSIHITAGVRTKQ